MGLLYHIDDTDYPWPTKDTPRRESIGMEWDHYDGYIYWVLDIIIKKEVDNSGYVYLSKINYATF